MNILTLAFKDGPISTLEALNVSLTGIVVVMIVLAFLAVLVVLLSKGIRLVIKDGKAAKVSKKAKDETPAPAPAATVQTVQTSNVTAIPDNQSMGSLDLYKTDEKTAAVIMAIISNESGIPLNRLNFKSIKLVEEQGGK